MTDNNITFKNVIDKFDHAYAYLSKYPVIHSLLKIVFKFILIIILVSFAHWALVVTYIKYCFSTEFIGAIKNILTLGSPFCQFLNYAQFELSKHYITIWASAAVAAIAWTIAKLK